MLAGAGEPEAHGGVGFVLVALRQDGGAHMEGCAEDFGPDPLQLATFLREFLVAAARDVVVIQDAVPVNLRAKTAGAPAEMEDAIRAVGDGLVGPKPHLPRSGRLVQVGPLAARAPLLLGNDVRAGGGARLFVLEGAPEELARKIGHESGIDIDSVEIQISGEFPVVHVCEGAVVGDPPARLRGPQDFHLPVLELAQGGAQEPKTVEMLARVGMRGPVEIRKPDLLKIVVRLRPKGRAPGAVKRGDVPVFILQPGAEGGQTGGAIALGDVAQKFIVRLPADDMGTLREMARHRLGNPLGFPAELRVVRTTMLAAAMGHAAALCVHAHPFVVPGGEPAGRGG